MVVAICSFASGHLDRDCRRAKSEASRRKLQSSRNPGAVRRGCNCRARVVAARFLPAQSEDWLVTKHRAAVGSVLGLRISFGGARLQSCRTRPQKGWALAPEVNCPSIPESFREQAEHWC